MPAAMPPSSRWPSAATASASCWVDFYPAGTEDPSEEHAPAWTVPVQAATPVPPADANGRITPPADTLVLDTTVNVPYAPQQLVLAAFDAPPLFPKYPPHITLSWPYPPTGGPAGRQLRRHLHPALGPQTQGGTAVGVLSFDRYDTTAYSAEIVADVDNCRLFSD